MKIARNPLWAIPALLVAAQANAQAQSLTFLDPIGDDFGPGEYVYPTDAIYKRGSFDLSALIVTWNKADVIFNANMVAQLEDGWGTGHGFSVQQVFVFVRTGAGKHTGSLPGLNNAFAAPGWDKVIILSPAEPVRVKQEVAAKAANLAADIVIPAETEGLGQNISARVPLASLGGGDPSKWAYQVVVQSYEGFPSDDDLMTRKVNEYEGQHRFGGGTDYDCDPHVLDILASGGGADSAIAAQKQALTYQCGDDGSAVKQATLPLIRK